MSLRTLLESLILLTCYLMLSVTTGCGDRLIKPKIDDTSRMGRCKQQPEQTLKIQAGVQAGFKYGLMNAEGQAGYDQLVEVKNTFDTLQADYAQMSYQLCEDSAAGAVSQKYYERRRECLDQGLLAMRAMEVTFNKKTNTSERGQLEGDLAWELESKLSWLQEVLACPKSPSNVIMPSSAPSAAASITLTAYLVCQRRVRGAFVDVPDCTKTPLSEGDRIKIGFKANRSAHFYIFNYNNTGLFQMLFPDHGVANKIEAEREYLIPVDGWLELDDQQNVTEHLQVVASIERLPQLERLRGTYVESNARSKTRQRHSKVAVQTRGLLEPVLTRGFKQKAKKPIKLDVGEANPVMTVPMVTTRSDVNVIEFKLRHK